MVKLIGICGGSGSGKTSFVKELKSQLDGLDVCFISFDDYYKPREKQLVDENGIKNFDLPESMEMEQFFDNLESLKRGESIIRKEYNFNNELAVPKDIEIKPAKVIFIEGLFIYYYKKLKDQFDLKVFISADDEIKIIRRIKRDQTERNYPLDDVLYRYKHHVIPAYKKFIEPYVGEMDLIVNNNETYKKAAEVLSAYVKSLVD